MTRDPLSPVLTTNRALLDQVRLFASAQAAQAAAARAAAHAAQADGAADDEVGQYLVNDSPGAAPAAAETPDAATAAALRRGTRETRGPDRFSPSDAGN